MAISANTATPPISPPTISSGRRVRRLAAGALCLELRLGACQQLGAIAIERVDLLELAERNDRLKQPLGGEMLARLLIELGLVVARLRGWRRRMARRSTTPRLAAVVGRASC